MTAAAGRSRSSPMRASVNRRGHLVNCTRCKRVERSRRGLALGCGIRVAQPGRPAGRFGRLLSRHSDGAVKLLLIVI
jgi:hypothetical protein